MEDAGKRNTIKVTNASEHNLRDVSVEIPHNSLTVITGVSGSGKSSLAYDVIFKESQRRFLESFSSFSRLYLGKLEKPAVQEITGLQAAVAINQKTVVSNPRSTVGTMSGIYDFLRLLYARTGTVICPSCRSEKKDRRSDSCPSCGTAHPEVLARLFSFNSPYGACDTCKGLGVTETIDPEKLIADKSKSLRQGALVPTTPTGYIVYSQVRVDELDKVCQAHGFSVDIPWNDLSKEQQDIIWYGSDRVRILFGKHSLESRLKWKGITAKPREEAFYGGMIPIMEDILARDRNDNILRFASSIKCPDCSGKRIRKEALAVYVNGNSIADLSELTLSKLKPLLTQFLESNTYQEVSEHILEPALKRLNTLQMLGLDYLSLDRESTSLSGGESQRIRLASQIGSGLQGILYVLDEPSIGLHPSDNSRMLKVLRSLQANGNTVVVVEHDEETIRSADYLIDIGPKAGLNGGKLIYQGITSGLLAMPDKWQESLTAKTFAFQDKIASKSSPSPPQALILLTGANKHNLKNLDVKFRTKALNVVTGVSGAGKSSLVHGVLAPAIRDPESKKNYSSITNPIKKTRVIEINQAPIGRTPRSNPATYTGLFDHIRDLFAKQPESMARGYKKGRFSFNNTGGRCEKCQGAGSIQLGMHFLGDVEISCESCQGKRFNVETLEITYRGKNISQVLELSVLEAIEFFEGEFKIISILDQLFRLDVGYLKLGQSSTTLSGGEAQRIKLASELHKSSAGHVLYILDEPSVGLHKADISHLLSAIGNLIQKGNTVIMIEHDLDIIQQADHLVDLGPGGGDAGGQLLVQGTLKDIMNCTDSLTGNSLRKYQTKTQEIRSSIIEPSPASSINFKGITTNNLKNIDATFPLNKTTVITGVSGSGKSSLAFDTLYAESRNRFTENLSTYARRMMSKVKKAESEQCSGLTPAIAIRQTPFSKNPRSTIGTVSEIYDLYRLLFSRAGKEGDGKFTSLISSDFSFNNPDSSCSTCSGLGIKITTSAQRCITSPEKSLLDGALDGTLPGKYFGDPFGQFVNTLKEVGQVMNIDFNIPYGELDEGAKIIALYGTREKIYTVRWEFKRGNRSGSHELSVPWKGFINYINEEYQIRKDGKRGEAYFPLMEEVKCPTCNGGRLKEDQLYVRFNGINIQELASMPVSSARIFLSSISSSLDQESIQRCEALVSQLIGRLTMLTDMGLDYIAIDRPTSSLSGGEAQRLRIATHLVSDLCGLTYVFDEPTLGLHPRDTEKLLTSIQKLKDRGNTIVIVEHDPDVISKADYIMDMGPGAGKQGGEIVASGTWSDILNNPNSPTGLALDKFHIRNLSPAYELTDGIKVERATARNLKSINLDIPLGALVCLTGVSGSGKSSLAFEVIARSIQHKTAINCKTLETGKVDDLVMVSQEKIGTSPLSTPATYTGAFDKIRELFARLPESKKMGLKKSFFSFNSKDGQCKTCKGMGRTRVSMDFLSDVWLQCDSCFGQRFNSSVRTVHYKGKTISDILQLEINEAFSFFKDHVDITETLGVLKDIGLGYLTLGQPTTSLSGGETQRLKLATRLLQKTHGHTLFIFDEPSTGLHMKDVEVLFGVFQQLIKQGHSLLVIEHNPHIIAASDWIIELGPQGGDEGGKLIYSGPTKQIRGCKESAIASYLPNGS